MTNIASVLWESLASALAVLPACICLWRSLATSLLATTSTATLSLCVSFTHSQEVLYLTITDAPSIATFIGQIGIVILVTFSIPLQVHPCRASLDAVLKWRPNRAHNGNGRSNSPVGGRSDHAVAPMSDLRFAVLTTLILVFGYLVALSVTSLERVLAYVGSIGSTSISFILPGLFYYKISDPESVHHQKLLKEDDDAAELHEDSDIEDSAAMVASIQSLGSAASVAIDPRKWRKKWRWDLEHLEHDLLRKAGLALAIYGICVMTVCLVMNIVFHASH